jgi:flavin-dependent dehydrogenase
MIDLKGTVEFEKLVFEKVQLRVQEEMCLEGIKPTHFEYFVNDYSRNVASILTLEMYERVADEKQVEFIIERPTFLDWLLRRTKTKTVKVRLKDILKDSNAHIQGRPYIEMMHEIKRSNK